MGSPSPTRMTAVLMCISLIAGCTPSSMAKASSAQSPRLVWGNAFAVAHPDYRVIHDMLPGLDTRNDDVDSMTVLIEPRWPTTGLTAIRGRQTGFLSRNAPGQVKAPLVVPWKMTGILQGLGVMRDDGGMRNTATLLESLEKAEVRVAAVVEFKQPVQDSEARKIWTQVPDAALFSPAEGKLPISWDQTNFCESRGFDACKLGIKDSLIEEFRHWVSLLTSHDESTLNSFGLSLAELQNRAQQGLYYGFILNTYPRRLLRLIDDSRIRSIKIADVALDSN